MFEFSKAKIKSSIFHKIFIWRKFDNLCKALLNIAPNRLFKLKTWEAYKDIVELKFKQNVCCTGKWDYHTVITYITSSNVFAVVRTGYCFTFCK